MRRALIGVVLAGLALGPDARWPAVRGAIEARGPDGLGQDALACVACHAGQVAEWQGSRHAVSASNAVFRAAWDARPDGWCLGCHLPVAEEQVRWLGERAVPGQVRSPDRPSVPVDGVGCAACHLDGGQVLARAATSAGQAAHPVREDPTFGSPAFCGRCHEFPFQQHTSPFTLGHEPSQATVSEWAGSDAAARGEDCRSCHMPAGAHTFRGAHDPSLVRGSVALTVHREGPEIVAALTGDAPHRVPTGDPFRRLELRLFDAQGVRLPETPTFRRTFDATPTSWVLRDDRALPPSRGGTSRRELRADAPGATAWELWMLFGDRRHEDGLQPEDVGYLVHQGAVSTQPPPVLQPGPR